MASAHRAATGGKPTAFHGDTSVLDGGSPLPPGIGLFLMQLTVIMVVTKLLAGVLKKFHQPSVVAEVLGGILLGPSALGSIPGYLDNLFPQSSLAGFTLVANLGLVLYLFLVGLELDPAQIFKTGPTALKIAMCGIAVPFALGALVAILLHKELAKDPEYADVPLSSLMVFTGVGMSITAFPVLARILTETTLITTPIGVMTLSAAAFNDAVAWCLLAVAIALVQSGSPINAVYIFLIMLGYCAFLFLAVRPMLSMAVKRVNESHSTYLRSGLLGLVFICIFVSGWFMQIIGLDAIFGAFLVGVILPRDEGLVHVVEKLEDIVRVVFLPMYFTLSGLKTNIESVNGLGAFGLFMLVLFLAVAGKMIGCVFAARMSGLNNKDSIAIGLLMNTRGLVELIVLNLGLQAKVINVEIFTIMVLMALVTTFMTTPAIRIFYPKECWVLEDKEAVAVLKEKGPDHRRHERLELGPTQRRQGEGGLKLVVSAEEAPSMVVALYLLLPADATNTTVITTLFYDSLTTTAVVNERLGYVDDPDAQQIRVAGELFGAHMQVKTIAATGNVSERLTRLMAKSDVDMCILPWSGWGISSHVDYEKSTWLTLPKVEGTIVLFHDGHNMQTPKLLAKYVDGYCNVLVLLHGEEIDENAVLDVLERMMLREGIKLHVCAYGPISKETADQLEHHKITFIPASREDGLTQLLVSHKVDLVVYTGQIGKRHHDHHHHGDCAGSMHGHATDNDRPYVEAPMSVVVTERRGEEGNNGEGKLEEDEAEEGTTRELVRRVLSHMPGRSLSVMEVYRGTGGKHELEERAAESVAK